MGWESGAAAITAAVARDSGAADDDLVPADRRPHAVVDAPVDLPRRAARACWPARTAGSSSPGCGSTADRAYDQLAGGFGDYGRAG